MSLRASLNSGLRLPSRAEKGEEVYSGVDAEQELSDPREGMSLRASFNSGLRLPPRAVRERVILNVEL